MMLLASVSSTVEHPQKPHRQREGRPARPKPSLSYFAPLADLAICCSGALTLSEMCSKPSGVYVEGGGHNLLNQITASTVLIGSDSNVLIDSTIATVGFIKNGTGDGIGVSGNFNVVADNTANNVFAAYGVGILVSAGASNNLILRNTVTGWSSVPGGGPDLMDGNPNCDHNHWIDNTFDTAEPSSCVK